jgi:hypothetical protein
MDGPQILDHFIFPLAQETSIVQKHQVNRMLWLKKMYALVVAGQVLQVVINSPTDWLECFEN